MEVCGGCDSSIQHTLIYTHMPLMDGWNLAPVSVRLPSHYLHCIPSPSSPLVSLTSSEISSFRSTPMPPYSSVYKLGLRPSTSYLAVTIAVYINVLTSTQTAAAIEWDFSSQSFLISKQRTAFYIGAESKAFCFLWNLYWMHVRRINSEWLPCKCMMPAPSKNFSIG